MPRQMARIGAWGRISAETSALPRCPARGGAAGAPCTRISFLFHSVVSQQFRPDRATQKPSNILLCQGIRHSDPPTWGQHLAGNWQASEWGLTHLLAVRICSITDGASTQARGNWVTSLHHHRAEGSQAPPRTQFLPEYTGSTANLPFPTCSE